MVLSQYFRLVFILFFLFCISIAQAGIEGSVSGTVVDNEGVGLSDAKVQLVDENGKVIKETQTSITGEYQFFPVQAGDYHISITRSGAEVYHTGIHIETGANTVADAKLGSDTTAQKEMVLEVKAHKHLLPASSSASRTEVSQSQIRQLPQGSEISLPKLLATTGPGVVAGPFGQLFFRGNHANIQYQIDGVQMPESPSNTFGQAFSPRNIDHMEVITGGIPAEYGQRLGAVVNIVTKTGAETPGGELELNYGSYNTTSPHLLYGGSNESGSLHYFLSLNYNRTDRGLDTPQPQSTDSSGQFQGGKDSVHNVATGNGQFAKVDWQTDNSNKLTFIAFHSQNNFQIPTYPSSFSPSDDFFHSGYRDAFGNEGEGGAPTYVYVPSNTDAYQSEINAYAQVVWKHTFSEKTFLQLAPYYKYSSIFFHNDPVNDLYTSPSGAFPIVNPNTGLSNATSFAANRHVNNLGLKGDYATRPSQSHLLKTGFQVQASRADGYYSIQRDLQGPIYSQTDPNTGYFQGVYIQDDYTIAKPLVLNAGLRFDATQFHFSGADSSDSALQPRIGLNYKATDTTKFHVFYGRLFQPSPIENLRTTFDSVNPNPASYDIKAEKDDYYEVGVAQQILGNQVAMLNVYYKNAINMLDDAQLLNTAIAQPFNYAEGYAYGIELSLKGQITNDWSQYVNYSYGIAKGKGLSGGAWAAEAPETDGYQFLDHVQEHTANAGLTYAKNYFWWTGQGVFGSGLRTGHDKDISLPSHFTMDTTVGYEFHGDSWLSKFRLSGDVLNVFDNVYPITIANGFNGSHYYAGRQFFLRLAKEL